MCLSLKRHFAAFTLIEMAIVLMIIGMIAGAIFKGQDLLEAAKARAILNDFNHFRMAIQSYQETYGALPGDDPMASQRFSQVNNGDGDGIIGISENINFWQHLYQAGQVSQPKAPTSKFGGKYSVVYKPFEGFDGRWLMLGKEMLNGSIANGGLLTPKQAQMIKSRADDGLYATNPTLGSIRVTEGAGISKGQCVRNNFLNLDTKAPVCIILMGF